MLADVGGALLGVGIGMHRIERDGLGVISYGPIAIPQCLCGDAPIIIGHAKSWIQVDGAVEIQNCKAVFAASLVCEPAIGEGWRIRSKNTDRLTEMCDGKMPFASLNGSAAKKV